MGNIFESALKCLLFILSVCRTYKVHFIMQLSHTHESRLKWTSHWADRQTDVEHWNVHPQTPTHSLSLRVIDCRCVCAITVKLTMCLQSSCSKKGHTQAGRQTDRQTKRQIKVADRQFWGHRKKKNMCNIIWRKAIAWEYLQDLNLGSHIQRSSSVVMWRYMVSDGADNLNGLVIYP